LLAEDNPINQKVGLLQLRNLSCQVDAVGNGLEAVDAARRVPYDIILMDFQMPELDGCAAACRIREHEKNTPSTSRHYIIALTASAMKGDREAALAAGMDDYLSKPVRTTELRAALSRGIERLSGMAG
jgi:CheY-like chemotaxis protein